MGSEKGVWEKINIFLQNLEDFYFLLRRALFTFHPIEHKQDYIILQNYDKENRMLTFVKTSTKYLNNNLLKGKLRSSRICKKNLCMATGQ